jgi:hypothetical protein
MNAPRRVVAPVVLALAVSLGGVGASADPIDSLPARILVIEDGMVSFQAALVVDTSNPLLRKFPTRYMLYVSNRTSSPVWLKMDWRVPGQEPFSSFGKVDAMHRVSGWVNAGKKVAWDQEIAVDVALFADEKRERALGGREVAFSFDSKDAAQFLAQAKEVNRALIRVYSDARPLGQPMLAGFREMDLVTPVPGTSAGAEEQYAAKLLLSRQQSIEYWDCQHRVLDARALDPRQLDFEDLDADVRARLEAPIEGDGLHLEEWRVESCDQVNSFLMEFHRRPDAPGYIAISRLIESDGPGGDSPEP